MSGNAAAVLTKPAFRKIEWLERDIAVERRPDGVIILKSRIPLKPYEKHIPASLAKWAKEAPDRIWLAQRGGAGPAMAQTFLWRGQAHGRRADAGPSQSRARARPPGRDPVRQFDRARADDAGRDAGAVSGSAGVAGLFADEPGSRQAEISVRPDQAGRGDGAGRPDLREGVEGARSRRRHRRPCRASLRRHQEHRVCRSRGNAGHQGRRRIDRGDHAGYRRQAAVHLGLDRDAQGRHQHASDDVRQCGDDDAGAAARSECAAGDLSRLDAVESHHGRQCAVQSGADRRRHALHRRWPSDAGP